MRSLIRMARTLTTLAALALGLLAAHPAAASAEYVADGSFEAALHGSQEWSNGSNHFVTVICDAPTCGDANQSMVPRTGAAFTWFGGTADVESAFISQQVTVPAGRPTVLSFWVRAGAPRFGSTIRVSVGDDQVWAFDEQHLDDDDRNDHPYADYTRIEVPIPGSAFDGSPTPLRFDFTSPGASTAVNYAIDDVSLVDGPSADASASLTPTSGTAQLGDVVTYDLALTNDGPSSAAVTLRGTLPPELELVSAGGVGLSCAPPTNPGGELVCDGGMLAPGASVTGQVVVRAVAVGTPSLTMSSVVAEPAVDPNPTNDSASTTLVIEPVSDLVATIDAPSAATVDEPFDVTVGARNDGPSPATDATTTTELPAGFTVADHPADCAVSGTTVTCDVGAVAVGDELERTLSVVPASAGAVELETAVAATEHDPDPANDRSVASVLVADPPEEPEPPVTTPGPPTQAAPPTLPAPIPAPPVTPEPRTAPVCLSKRRFSTRLLRGRSGPGLRINASPSRARIVSARLSGGPRSWKARNAPRTRSQVRVDLRGAPASRYTLRVRVRIAATKRSKARTVTVTRHYRTCTPAR